LPSCSSLPAPSKLSLPFPSPFLPSHKSPPPLSLPVPPLTQSLSLLSPSLSSHARSLVGSTFPWENNFRDQAFNLS
jgi:hypothetical protein